MTIDAKELREAIEHVRTRETWNISPAEKARQALLAEAASLYLATLPREVEVVDWGITNGDGRLVVARFASESSAKRGLELYYALDHQVVRLTGTVTLPPGGKD